MTPAQAARERAGYGGSAGLTKAAKLLRCSEKRLRHAELHGQGSDDLCVRAGRLFKCDPGLLFHRPDYIEARSHGGYAIGGAEQGGAVAALKPVNRSVGL